MSSYQTEAAVPRHESSCYTVWFRHGAERATVCGLIVALLGGLPSHVAFAEQAPGAATPATSSTSPQPSRPAITRADLAAAYLRLEQAFFCRPLPPEEVARINKGFDQATQAFFLGSNAEAIRRIDSLTESLEPEERKPSERGILSLRVIVDPPVLLANTPQQVVCRVTSIYDWPAHDPTTSDLRLRLVGPQDRIAMERSVAVPLGKGSTIDIRVLLEPAADRLAPGLYRIELAPDEGHGVAMARVHVIDGAALDQQQLANDKRLQQVDVRQGQLARALAICRARNRLLSDHPSEDNSAQFLADLNRLASDVASETSALESGKNPYWNRPGDYWRVLEVGTREIPLRLYVPKGAAGETPTPLLVVLHGMGGDENMFFEAYGAGLIKSLADQKRLIVASPLTYSFGSDIKTLHALIDALGNDYSIDRDRVYVLGHSMGAGAASGLARGNSDTVAAACCIAGGRFQPAQDSAPILVVSPELDGIVVPKRLQESARQAISEGMPGELKIMPDYGHTLAVGAILPEAIDWLLRHRRATSP